MPYPGTINGQRVANGIALDTDVPDHVPGSLQHIYNVLGSEHRTPKDWVSNGVILLNTSLTTELGESGKHKEIIYEGKLYSWANFIKETLEIIAALNDNHIVYLLTGAGAREFKQYINSVDNYVIETAHPSPRNTRRENKICREHFEWVNNYLYEVGKSTIQW